MNSVYFFIASIFFYSSNSSVKEKIRPCTCISYELKDQLKEQEIVSYAKVIQIDTIRISQSNWCKDKNMRDELYKQKELMLKVTFKNKGFLKGNLASDTFSVISLNYCQFDFSSNFEYIVAARHNDFCELRMNNGSVTCTSVSLFCTNYCSGNSIYYEGSKDRYLEALK